MKLEGIPDNIKHDHHVAVSAAGAVQVQLNNSTTENVIRIVESVALATSGVIIINALAKILARA
jgi:hypothetical protein